MRNLHHLRGKYISKFDDLINSKYEPGKSRLILLRPFVASRYLLYRRGFVTDNLHNIAPVTLSNQENADLSSCYGTSTALLGELVSKIKLNQHKDCQGTCQYCGIQKPNSIDHYMPQSSYPEFSVHPLNLIPCCVDCNGKKNAFWLKSAFRGIINFYLDKLPNIQFLFVDFEFDLAYSLPNIRFYIDLVMITEVSLSDIIESHFDRLDLCNRFLDYTHDFVTDKIISIVSYLNSKDPSDITERIVDEGRKLEQKYGLNNWKTVLIKSMAVNINFINYLVRVIP